MIISYFHFLAQNQANMRYYLILLLISLLIYGCSNINEQDINIIYPNKINTIQFSYSIKDLIKSRKLQPIESDEFISISGTLVVKSFYSNDGNVIFVDSLNIDEIPVIINAKDDKNTLYIIESTVSLLPMKTLHIIDNKYDKVHIILYSLKYTTKISHSTTPDIFDQIEKDDNFKLKIIVPKIKSHSNKFIKRA